MTAKQVSMGLAWLLVMLLLSLLLMTFAACSDDITGPRIEDEQEEKKDEDDHEGGGLAELTPNCEFPSSLAHGRFAEVDTLLDLG